MTRDANRAALTVKDYADYNLWRSNCNIDEHCPTAAVFLLGDSSILFHHDDTLHLPWIQRLRCELPPRDVRIDGSEYPVKASYIGYGTHDDSNYYEVFLAAMALINITDCRQVHEIPSTSERAHLEQSDVIVLGGGCGKTLWNAMEKNDVMEQIRWRYFSGCVLVGVGEGATVLGNKIWYKNDPSDTSYIHVKGFDIVPFIVGPDTEELENVVESIGAGTVALALPRGGCVIFNRDGLFEPCRMMARELRWDWIDNCMREALLLPPPGSTGLLVAMERLCKLRGSQENNDVGCSTKEELELQTKEDACEDRALEALEQASVVKDVDIRRSDELRQEGNALLKSGDDISALSKYKEAAHVNPRSEAAHMNIAHMHMKLGDPVHLALRAANNAVAVTRGRSAKAWYRRACAFEAAEDGQNAYQDLDEAYVLAPDDRNIIQKRSLLEKAVTKAKDEFFYSNHIDADDAYENLRRRPGADVAIVVDAITGFPARALWIWQDLLKCNRTLVSLIIQIQLGAEGIRFLSEGLKSHPTLEVLRLSGCHLRPAGISYLSTALSQNDTLRELDLDANAIRDAGMRMLCREGLLENSSLEKLSLAHNHIGLDGTSVLCELFQRPNCALMTVSLDYNSLDFDSARQLANSLRDNTIVEKISLVGNHMGSDSVWRLAAVAGGHSSLRLIDMRGIGVSAATVRRIRERFKYQRCNIIVGLLDDDSDRLTMKNGDRINDENIIFY